MKLFSRKKKNSPAEDPSEKDESELEFRVLKSGEWSQGLRLEHPFWVVLKNAAGSIDQSLANYVKSLLQDYNGKNKTSFLRTTSLQWLVEKHNRHVTYFHNINLLKNLHLSPVPSIGLRQNGQIISFNVEFVDLIKKVTRRPHLDVNDIKVSKIELPYPVEKIVQSFKGDVGASLQLEFTFVIHSQNTRFHAKACLVPEIKPSMLILYITNCSDF